MLKKWVTQRRKDAKVRECHKGIFAALRLCVSLIRDFFNMLLAEDCTRSRQIAIQKEYSEPRPIDHLIAEILGEELIAPVVQQ